MKPYGIYSLNRIVDAAYVDGVVARHKWSDLEPQEGYFDFTKVKALIESAQAIGQSVVLEFILAEAPAWLSAKAATWNDIRGRTSLVPWDELSLAALGRLVKALAAYQVGGIPLATHPAVSYVHCAVNGTLAVRFTTSAKPPGYTPELYSGAVMTSVGFWIDAFPSKEKFVGMFPVKDGANSEVAICDQLCAMGLHAMQDNLKSDAPDPDGALGAVLLRAKAKGAGVMLQALEPWSDGTPYEGFLFANGTYGTTYVEFYDSDLSSTAWASSFRKIQRRLDQVLASA